MLFSFIQLPSAESVVMCDEWKLNMRHESRKSDTKSDLSPVLRPERVVPINTPVTYANGNFIASSYESCKSGRASGSSDTKRLVITPDLRRLLLNTQNMEEEEEGEENGWFVAVPLLRPGPAAFAFLYVSIFMELHILW